MFRILAVKGRQARHVWGRLMRSRWRLVVRMVMVLARSPLEHGAALSEDAAPARDDWTPLAVLEAELDRLQAELRLPGLAAGIIRGDELWWFKGYGLADRENTRPVTAETPFHLASLTKTFASTLLLQLVEQGKLDLEQPVSDFGIDLKSEGIITVRHLFSHTSHGVPGTGYRYDGSRFGLLDKMLEQITGMSFRDYLQKTIITPLGLKDTGGMDDALTTQLAAPYVLNKQGELEPGKYPEHFGSSAGMVASVADYARYILALKQNRFLRPETRAQAFAPARSNSGKALPYGLGWFTENIGGTDLIWHYGYWNSASSLVLMVPEQDTTFIAFANSDGLSRGFGLGKGKIVRSPAAQLFLHNIVFNGD
jgi:CubicO group peptidase (beta-lactamase class C family)